METKTMTYMQALRLAMDEELARDDKVILLGQDVGILGGAYGVTGDLYHKYGPDRIIDSPLAENAIVGFGIGAAMMGWRPIMEIMKMDFSMVAVDPIVNHLAKYRFMSGGQIEKMPAVVRTAIGGGTRSGPHHSYSLHHIFAGLRGDGCLSDEGRGPRGYRLHRPHRQEQGSLRWRRHDGGGFRYCRPEVHQGRRPVAGGGHLH